MAKQYLDGNGVRYLWTKLKNLLSDTVPSKSEVAANTEARHTHNNKIVLDGISASNITSWNNKTDNYIISLEYAEDGTITATNYTEIKAAYNARKRIYIDADGSIIPLYTINNSEAEFSTIFYPVNEQEFTTATIIVDLRTGDTKMTTRMYTIPTKTSDLTNDSGFITSADGGNAATVNGLKFVVASEPPTNADSNTITFVV